MQTESFFARFPFPLLSLLPPSAFLIAARSGSGRAQGPRDQLVYLSLMSRLVPFERSQKYWKAPGMNLTVFLSATLNLSLLELDYHGICGILFLLLLHPGQAVGLLHWWADVTIMSKGHRRAFLWLRSYQDGILYLPPSARWSLQRLVRLP